MNGSIRILGAAIATACGVSAQEPATGGDIRGLHDAIAIPAASAGMAWLWWAVPVAVCGLGLCSWWLAARKLGRRVDRPAPADVARATLSRADAERLAAGGDPALAAVLLQAALRSYLQARCELPAEARTAHELAVSLQADAFDDQALLQRFAPRLIRLLHACDDAVYAQQPIDQAEWGELTATVDRFIDERERELAEAAR